jgi:N-acetylglutamate synthase-like GNAT family acetyltransferase
VRIRRAAISDEAASLTKIAHEAKRYWGYPERWIKHWEQDLTITPEFISNNDVYVAEADGELLGFYALVVNNNRAELEHFWVSPAHIGRGIGKELFVHAMQVAAGQDVQEVEICADPNAEGFYQHMGAARVGEVTSEIEGQSRVLPRLAVNPHET